MQQKELARWLWSGIKREEQSKAVVVKSVKEKLELENHQQKNSKRKIVDGKKHVQV